MTNGGINNLLLIFSSGLFLWCTTSFNCSAQIKGGLSVLNDAASIVDVNYNAVGTKWEGIGRLATHDEQDIQVTSIGDLPPAINGIITLQPGAVYAINGTLSLEDRIDLNGATLKGMNRNRDRLIYSGTMGELFTGQNGGVLYNLSLSSPGTSTALLNLDASALTTGIFIMESCAVTHCSKVGRIKGFKGFVIFSSCSFAHNDEGIVLEDLGDFAGDHEIWDASNAGTFQKFVGRFGTILKEGGQMKPSYDLSATAMDISRITSIRTAAGIRNTSFTGNGTYVNGTFNGKWDLESSGLPVEKDEAAVGMLALSSASNTTFSATGIPVKISGATAARDLFRFSSDADGRLAYTGYLARTFSISYSLSVSAPIKKGIYSFYIAKNGFALNETKKQLRFTGNNTDQSLMDQQSILLAAGDYIEVWVSNDTDRIPLLVSAFSLVAQ